MFTVRDMPEANELVVGMMALVTQQGRKAISQRTKEALATARGSSRSGAEVLNLGDTQALCETIS